MDRFSLGCPPYLHWIQDFLTHIEEPSSTYISRPFLMYQAVDPRGDAIRTWLSWQEIAFYLLLLEDGQVSIKRPNVRTFRVWQRRLHSWSDKLGEGLK